MEKLLDEQVLNLNKFDQTNFDVDVLVTVSDSDMEVESKIGSGNLKDYLEIYGELADN